MKKIIALTIVTIISLTSVYAQPQGLVINDRNATIKMDCTGVNGDGNFIMDIQVLSKYHNESDNIQLRLFFNKIPYNFFSTEITGYKQYLYCTSGITKYVGPDFLKTYINGTETKIDYIKYPSDRHVYSLHNSKKASKQLKEYFQQLLDWYNSPLCQELIANAKKENAFIKEKDEFSFSDITWVKPKDVLNGWTGAYCYFSTENGKATSNFRFVYNYYSNDWLFIHSMIFNIDGEIIRIIPDMKTDCGSRYAGIREWCDVSVNYNTSGINEDFIKKIANATSVKVKMQGKLYYDVKTLSAFQIKSIKDTYEYYLALGGRFTN